ncbi:golgin subfamily A member 6-like protein 2 [Schistocerca gregaria]|uniref:golgin subfamily A member 6-like protein 2 n=1 Tax=Schistocerca gregaria TaxID=7010 RepID=UPI00211DDF39|nr:golgin subfamily A member 6-like protein 2 [Schistocerca gregaria]
MWRNKDIEVSEVDQPADPKLGYIIQKMLDMLVSINTQIGLMNGGLSWQEEGKKKLNDESEAKLCSLKGYKPNQIEFGESSLSEWLKELSQVEGKNIEREDILKNVYENLKHRVRLRKARFDKTCVVCIMAYSYEAQEKRIRNLIEEVMAERDASDSEDGEIDFEEVQDPEWKSDFDTEQKTSSDESEDSDCGPDSDVFIGVKCAAKSATSPLQCWELFFDENIIHVLVGCTDSYIQSIQENSTRMLQGINKHVEEMSKRNEDIYKRLEEISKGNDEIKKGNKEINNRIEEMTKETQKNLRKGLQEFQEQMRIALKERDDKLQVKIKDIVQVQQQCQVNIGKFRNKQVKLEEAVIHIVTNEIKQFQEGVQQLETKIEESATLTEVLPTHLQDADKIQFAIDRMEGEAFTWGGRKKEEVTSCSQFEKEFVKKYWSKSHQCATLEDLLHRKSLNIWRGSLREFAEHLWEVNETLEQPLNDEIMISAIKRRLSRRMQENLSRSLIKDKDTLMEVMEELETIHAQENNQMRDQNKGENNYHQN